jgi:hypothetical protein
MKHTHLIAAMAFAALASAPALAQQQPAQPANASEARQAASGGALTREQMIGIGAVTGVVIAATAGGGGGGGGGFYIPQPGGPGGTTGTTGTR